MKSQKGEICAAGVLLCICIYSTLYIIICPEQQRSTERGGGLCYCVSILQACVSLRRVNGLPRASVAEHGLPAPLRGDPHEQTRPVRMTGAQ